MHAHILMQQRNMETSRHVKHQSLTWYLSIYKLPRKSHQESYESFLNPFNPPNSRERPLDTLLVDFYVGDKIGHGRIVFIGVPHGPQSLVGPNPEHSGVAKVVHVVQPVVVTVGGAIGHGTRVLIGVPHGPQIVAGPTPPGQIGVGSVVQVVQAVVVGGRMGQGMRVLIGVPHGPQRVFGPIPPGQRGVGKVVQDVQAVVVGGG
ncbi:hypothetical protein TWF730_007706 [Orbilia blumenaviensis]|uniref:Uncharacterized protein n=1 Tax=Orbilia blumenaviensis TaxID=1796055 RepID=A0AAV9V8N0_9PEZI